MRLSIAIVLIFLIPAFCFGQETGAGPSLHALMGINPALAGSDGNKTIRMTYMNYFPGNNYNLHSVYASYDAYSSTLHGGASFMISENYLGGIMNDLSGSLSYAYFLRAGKDFFINAGLSATIYHRGVNFSGAVLPDQIDPLGRVVLTSGETLQSGGMTVFDVSTGFLIIKNDLTAGLALAHLTEPDLSSGSNSGEQLRRLLLFHCSYNIKLNEVQNLWLQPLLYFEMQGGYVIAGAGTALKINHIAVNSMFLADNGKNADLQCGFSLSTGRLKLFYNYRFNMFSGRHLQPLSLMHQTGLAFVINNVEKRYKDGTINFPEL